MTIPYKQQYTIEGSYKFYNFSGVHLQKYKLEDWYDSKTEAEKCASNMTSKLNDTSFIYSMIYGNESLNEYNIHTRLVDFTTPNGDKNKIAILVN